MKQLKYFFTLLFSCFQLISAAQNVTVKVDTIMGCQGTVQLSYTTSLTVSSIIWNFGDGFTSADASPSIIHPFFSPGDFKIKLTLNGIDSDSVIVTIPACLIVPNVFTPNGDNSNDLFVVDYDGKSIMSFKVFTRAGIRILDLETKSIRWDGKLESGDKVLPGIYYYILEIKGAPSISKKGFFYVFY